MNLAATSRSFTDADLDRTLCRAMRTVTVLAVILFAVFLFRSGWRTAMLLLAGALISLGSLFEWRRLVLVMNARLDNQESPRSTSFVVVMFVLRISLAGLVLYGSLKCFQTAGYGSVVAITVGLCLAFIGLSVEAVKMLIL